MNVLDPVWLLIPLLARRNADFGGRLHSLAGIERATVMLRLAAGNTRLWQERASRLPSDLIELLFELGQARTQLRPNVIVCLLSLDLLQPLLQLQALLHKRIAQV